MKRTPNRRGTVISLIGIVVGLALSGCGAGNTMSVSSALESCTTAAVKAVQQDLNEALGKKAGARNTAFRSLGIDDTAHDIREARKDLTDQLTVIDKKTDECKDTSDSGGSDATKEDVNGQAALWVEQIVLNFRGVNKTPAKCQDWMPDVDLTEVHFYHEATNKESDTAFGTAMGTKPCEVAINMVERMYRDPMLLVDKAKSRGLLEFKPAEQVEMVNQFKNAPFEERRELADKVLGWYANPVRELTIAKYKGGYRSNLVSMQNGTPVATATRSNKASNVLLATNRKSGKVVAHDRLDCGLQDFVPDNPMVPPGGNTPPDGHGGPPPGTPVCPPGQHGRPPICKDDEGAGPAHNPRFPEQQKPNQLPAAPEDKQPTRPATPDPVYSSPAPAQPTKTPRPDPTPTREPDAPQSSAPAEECIPSPGKATCDG